MSLVSEGKAVRKIVCKLEQTKWEVYPKDVLNMLKKEYARGAKKCDFAMVVSNVHPDHTLQRYTIDFTQMYQFNKYTGRARRIKLIGYGEKMANEEKFTEMEGALADQGTIDKHDARMRKKNGDSYHSNISESDADIDRQRELIAELEREAEERRERNGLRMLEDKEDEEREREERDRQKQRIADLERELEEKRKQKKQKEEEERQREEDMERERKRKKQEMAERAKAVRKIVCQLTATHWEVYPDDVAELLRKEYKGKAAKVEFAMVVSGANVHPDHTLQRYRVDFEKMCQINAYTGRVRRVKMIGFGERMANEEKFTTMEGALADQNTIEMHDKRLRKKGKKVGSFGTISSDYSTGNGREEIEQQKLTLEELERESELRKERVSQRKGEEKAEEERAKMVLDEEKQKLREMEREAQERKKIRDAQREKGKNPTERGTRGVSTARREKATTTVRNGPPMGTARQPRQQSMTSGGNKVPRDKYSTDTRAKAGGGRTRYQV